MIIDHPQHRIEILGGMWGFYNLRDRNLSNFIFSLFANPKIAETYNKNYTNPKGFDQYFLKDKVYKLIKFKSIIHDSYHCNKSGFLGTPFPTRRIGDYFVGSKYDNYNSNRTFFECPVNCRPENNKNWTTC